MTISVLNKKGQLLLLDMGGGACKGTVGHCLFRHSSNLSLGATQKGHSQMVAEQAACLMINTTNCAGLDLLHKEGTAK